MSDIKKIADSLVSLSVKQVTELATILKDEYGIEPAAAPVAVAAAPSEAGAGNSAAAEKTEFDVVLKTVGSSKLAVVKLVKEITGLGLKEAKEKIDAAPFTIKEKLPKAEAEEMKSKLEAAGAKVTLS